MRQMTCGPESSVVQSQCCAMAALDLKWQRVENTSGPRPRPRHGHRAVVIQDLMVVFGGGNEGIIDELNVFNMSTNTWFVPATKGRIPPGCAAYGIAVYGTVILTFGGMVECGKYSDDLYELDVGKWEWRRLRPRPPVNGKPPCPRLGHSFTLVDNDVYLFGGLANVGQDSKNNVPLYLNDLYALDLQTKMTAWNIPETRGCRPSARESHTAVAYENKFTGSSRIIIYGGMNGRRLGDLWFLDCETFSWLKPVLRGVPPQPRSLHTAAVVGERMFVFGGWVPVSVSDGKVETPEMQWKCSNSLVSLNIEKLTWEEHDVGECMGSIPRARAGHCTVGVHTRMYVWSGRDGYRRVWNNQICFNDMWYIDVLPPLQPHKVQLAKAQTDELELCWTPVPAADAYRIQLHVYEMPSSVNTTANPPTPATSPSKPTSSLENSTSSSHDDKVSLPDLLPMEDNTCKSLPLASTSPINSRPVSPLLETVMTEKNDFNQQAEQCLPETLAPVLSSIEMPSSTTTPMAIVSASSHIKEDVASVSVLSTKPSLLSVSSGPKIPQNSQTFPDLLPESSANVNTLATFSLSTVAAPQTPLTLSEKIIPSVSVSLPTTYPLNSSKNSLYSISGLSSLGATSHRQHNFSGIIPPTTLLKNSSFPQSKPVMMQKPGHTSNSPLVTFVKTSQGVTVGVPRSSILQPKTETSQVSTVQGARQRQISYGGVKIFKSNQKPGLDDKEDWNVMLKQSQNPFRKQTVHFMKPAVPATEGTNAKFSSNGGNFAFTAPSTVSPIQTNMPPQGLPPSSRPSSLSSNIFQQPASKPSSVKIIVVSSATSSGGIVGKPITIMIPGGGVTPKTVHVGGNPITHSGIISEVSQYLASSLPSPLQFSTGAPQVAVTSNEKQQRGLSTVAAAPSRNMSSFSNCGPVLTTKTDNMGTRFSTAYDEHMVSSGSVTTSPAISCQQQTIGTATFNYQQTTTIDSELL